MGEDRKMTILTISNSGGTLTNDAYEWEEEQSVSLPIQPIPTKSSGSYVNTNIHVVNPKTLSITIKLTNAQKTTLDAIFNANEKVTITGNIDDDTGTWTYSVWFSKKPIVYKYVKSELDTFEWRADLEFIVESYSFS